MSRENPQPPPGTTNRKLVGDVEDVLIREEPLVIEVAGRTVLTMRTPGDDADLAIGFLLSEGVIESVGAVGEVRLVPGDAEALEPDSAVVQVHAAGELVRSRLSRTHEVRSSCGICGLANPDQLLDDLPPLLPGVPRLPHALIESLRQRFEALLPHFSATGASHGAVLFGADGTVWSQGEDVGRHNALDKAIGVAARAGRNLSHGIAMLSGRAGFDLVLKCLRMRIPVILSVSAPSAQSFDLCRAAGATLIGFVRAGRSRVYTDGGRLAD